MTWEYRIYEEAGYLEIVEAYLDDKGKPTGYGKAKLEGYQTRDQLFEALLKMLDALRKRALTPEDFEKEE
jgi:hypothetical protein